MVSATQIVQRLVYTNCQKEDRGQWYLWTQGQCAGKHIPMNYLVPQYTAIE